MGYTPTINRVSGMSSGMDTESLVRAMTMHQQSKIDMLLRKKTVAEWKSEALTEKNNMLRAFKDDFISVLGSKSLMKADAYNTYTVKNTSNAFSVTASAGAKAGLYKFQVVQMASGAKAVGAQFANEGYKIATNASLKALMNDNVARATSGGSSVHLTDSNGSPMFDGEGNPVMGFKFTINGQDFQFNENAKLSDVMNTINSSKAGVKLSYTELSNSFTLESTAAGKNSKLVVSEDGSGFFAMLGLDGQSGAGNVFDADALGQEAIVMINNQEYKSQSNTFTVDGMTFTLNDVTNGETFEFVIERDVSKSIDQIKTFVESLNELLSKMDADVRQKKNSKYSPLTEMLKEGMSEKEIELWESKAKEGLFYRDNRITSLLNSIRGAFTETIGNSGLREIGITFDKYAPGSAPKLVIDEEKLTKALEADPDRVYNLMTATPKDANDQGGVLHRVGAAIDKYTADTKSYDIQNLRDNVIDYVKRISFQEDKLYIMQERLYVKFAAFEKSLGSMQTQSSKISAYFG